MNNNGLKNKIKFANNQTLIKYVINSNNLLMYLIINLFNGI